MLRLRNDTGTAPPARPWLLARSAGREALWLAVALALLSCLPVLLAERPQMTDYPSHLARYYIMLHGEESAWLQRYYRFEWRWSGNLGVDLLMFPLARLFGLELAGKLVAAAIPPLTGLAMIAVEWTLRRRIGVGTMLALMTVWSPVMVIGLLNFALAFALALLAFALWVRLEGWRWRSALFLPLGLIVWLCHLAGWGVLGVLVFGYEWHRRRGPGAFLAPWPLFLPGLPMVLAGGPAGIGLYGANVLNYKLTIWFMALRDRIWWLDIDSVALIGVACLAALVFRRFDGRLGWAALFFVVLSLALPRHLGGGDYSDYRLVAVALTAGCLAIDWAPPRLLLWLAALPFLARLAVTASAWHAESREVEAMLKALDTVPKGAHIAAAVAMDTADWATDTFQHVPSYATIRNDALVNTHFAEPGVHMLQLRAGGPRFQDPSQRILRVPGKPIDLSAFPPAQGAQYLWYIGRQPPSRLPSGAVVVHRTPRSLMARLAKASPAR
jgi:hypothetical protein